jgi:hypothetical protein
VINYNNLAVAMKWGWIWICPLDKGNLLANGPSDVGVVDGGGVGFYLFGRGTEYGAILNEAAVINWRFVNPQTGAVKQGSYANKHFRWCDNYADQFATDITLLAPIRRIL